MRRLIVLVFLSILSSSSSRAAGLDRIPATSRPACTAGGPLMVFLTQESTSTDCDATGGGSTEALCCCINGSWAACVSGGGSSNSFATMNAPSGTDPAASSATDTLNFTAAGGISITGNSGTKTLAFDFASTSFLPAVSAPAVDAANSVWGVSTGIAFEGSSADANETTIVASNPTADRTLTLPNETGTLLSTASNYAASVSPAGPATTATALASNPADCSTSDGTETPWRINASADLSCVAIAFTSKTLDRKSSATTINNTVTETAVYSYTIPASTLDANGEIVLTLWSEFLNNTGFGRGYIIKVKLGGTTVIEFDMGSSALVSTATRRLSQTIVSLAALGATNSQIVTMRHEISSRTGLSGTLTTGVGTTMSTAVQMLTVNSGTLSQDMTTSKVLEVSITLSTNSTSLEWKSYAGTLELLNP